MAVLVLKVFVILQMVYPCLTVLPDPVAFWPLDTEDLLMDTSGNENHGVAGDGMVFEAVAEGTLYGAMRFTGDTDSFIEFPNNGAYDTIYSITMLAYIYPLGRDGPIFHYNLDNWGVYLNGGSQELSLMITKRDSLEFTETLSQGDIERDKWHFVGATYNQNTGTAKLWAMDQVLRSSYIGSVQLATNYAARMGARTVDSSETRARVSCMQIYDRELLPSEILEAESKCKIVKATTHIVPDTTHPTTVGPDTTNPTTAGLDTTNPTTGQGEFVFRLLNFTRF
ncbi:uncharacterized protein [Ptychodera flava]|uniref:uncharacterized protein isoform X2 n=1 Tax=Ptychodera flava TaxID=63121 RepID=UPI00396A0DE8